MAVILFASTAWAQGSPKKYPWQEKDTNCTHGMTFCWYGSDLVADPEVTAFGPRWVSQDKEEKPFEWVSAIRCVKALHICILARNQKLLFGGGSMTNIDLYHVQEWSEYEIRAVGENDLPHGRQRFDAFGSWPRSHKQGLRGTDETEDGNVSTSIGSARNSERDAMKIGEFQPSFTRAWNAGQKRVRSRWLPT
jgi:hypothetical protein